MTRVFARLSATEEWKKDVESNLWENTFLNREESRKFFRAEYDTLKGADRVRRREAAMTTAIQTLSPSSVAFHA